MLAILNTTMKSTKEASTSGKTDLLKKSNHTAPTIFPTYSCGFKKPKTMKLFYLLMIKFG